MTRRLVAALAAALVALSAVLGASAPPSALAAPSGLAGMTASRTCIDLDPDPSSPGSVGITVQGHGFEPGSTVDVYINVSGVESFPEPSDTRTVDELGVFEGRVSLLRPGEPLEYVISGVTRGGEGINANVNIAAPCPPTLEVTPTCMAPDTPFDISFRAAGFSPGSTIRVGIIVPPDHPDLIVSDPLTVDGQGRLEYTFTGVGPLPAGRYQAAAVGASGRNSIARLAVSNQAIAQAPIEMPCGQPAIAVDPTCGAPGTPPDHYDVTVVGSGFRYGSGTLTWDVGGSNETFPIDQIDDSGTFSVRVQPWQRSRGTRIRIRAEETFPYDDSDGHTDPLLGGYPTALYPPRVAETSFRVPCRPTATPLMDLDPDCTSPALQGDAERRYQIGLSASGLEPGPVDVVFDADAVAVEFTPPEHFEGEVGKDGVLPPMTITPLARPIGDYRVAIMQREVSIIDRVYRVPCETPTPVLRPIVPTCGPIAPGTPDEYPIRVRGRGFFPGAVELVFDQRGTSETASVTVGSDGTFDAQLVGSGRDRGEYLILARQRDARGTVLRASRPFTVPCLEPTIVIDPQSGPAGYATAVTGTDFPPGTTVSLTWDRGLTAGVPAEVTADGSGAFETHIFLLPHDLPGLRTLTAAAPTDPNAFPGVTADYLVVEGSGQPPGGPGDPGGVIFRR